MLLSPGPPALALPGQEEWPRADVDILVGAGQAAAVLFQGVPGVLVEVGHLAGEMGFSETDWDTCSQRAAPGLGAGTSTEPEGSSSGRGKRGSWKESHLAQTELTRVLAAPDLDWEN